MVHDGPIAAVRDLLSALGDKEGLAACVSEGLEISAIVEPLGLPAEIIAASQAYPAFRDGFLSNETLINNKLEDLSRILLGLEQLDQFSLPRHWQPGEALATQQSEALRKMLLAVVSDVRLVLVRIAHQLHRLRKPHPMSGRTLPSRHVKSMRPSPTALASGSSSGSSRTSRSVTWSPIPMRKSRRH